MVYEIFFHKPFSKIHNTQTTPSPLCSLSHIADRDNPLPPSLVSHAQHRLPPPVAPRLSRTTVRTPLSLSHPIWTSHLSPISTVVTHSRSRTSSISPSSSFLAHPCRRSTCSHLSLFFSVWFFFFFFHFWFDFPC